MAIAKKVSDDRQKRMKLFSAARQTPVAVHVWWPQNNYLATARELFYLLMGFHKHSLKNSTTQKKNNNKNWILKVVDLYVTLVINFTFGPTVSYYMKVNWHKVYVDLGFAIKNKFLRSLILEVKYCLQNTILQCYEQKWT